MESSNTKVTIYGKRLKDEAHKRGLKNQDMANLLHYSSEKQISPIYSGKKKLDDDRFKILSDAWGLRIEYLKCIDDFETNDALYKALRLKETYAHKAILSYLDSLGYTFSPVICWSIETSISNFLSLCDEQSDYFNDNGKKYVENIRNRASKPPCFGKFFVELKNMPFGTVIKSLDDLTKTSASEIENYNRFFYSSFTKFHEDLEKRIEAGEKLDIDKEYSSFYKFYDEENYVKDMFEGDVDLFYKVSHNGSYIGYCRIHEVDLLFNNIDGVCSVLLNNLVGTGEFLDQFNDSQNDSQTQ